MLGIPWLSFLSDADLKTLVDAVEHLLLFFRELIAFIAVGKQELPPAVFPIVAGMIETHPAAYRQFLHGEAQFPKLFPGGQHLNGPVVYFPSQRGAGPCAKWTRPDIVRIDRAEELLKEWSNDG